MALAWADAAQRVATDVYRRILRDPALLSEFKNDTSTRAFWALDENERRKRWGEPYSLNVNLKLFQLALSLDS